MKNHLVLYQAGLAGTFLVWLINQHKNFSQYPFQWKYTKRGHKLDLGCNGADWYHEDMTFAESRKEWEIEYNLYPMDRDTEMQPKVPKNKDRTKDAIKIIPNHCCQEELAYFNGTIDKVLLEKVMSQVNPTSIIIPIASTYFKDELLNRWIAYRKEHEKSHHVEPDSWEQVWYEDTFPWLKENAWRYGDNAHTIDIGKIVMNVESEYIKLCEIIDEEPLENIKEIISPFRSMMENWSRGISTV
jgi:hypothetical protein